MNYATLKPIAGHASTIALTRVFREAGLDVNAARMKYYRKADMTKAERRAIMMALLKTQTKINEVLELLDA